MGAGTQRMLNELSKLRQAILTIPRFTDAVITAVDTDTATASAYLGGDTTTEITDIPYSGSVYVPNVGETWVCESIQGSATLIRRKAAGPGSSPAAYEPPAASGPGFEVVFSYPGVIVSGGSSGTYLLHQASNAASLAVLASVATADSSTHDIEVTVYINGETLAVGTIKAGDFTGVTLQAISTNLGQAGDQISVAITAYTGTTASDLVVKVVAE